MRLQFLKSPICLIAALVVFIVCLLEACHVQTFQRLEWMSYDWRVRLAHHYDFHSVNEATNLGFVEISDNSIAAVNNGSLGYRYGLYWPRQIYGRALAELTRQGARAVAFDVVFAESRPDQPPMELPDGSSVDSDEYFARELVHSGNAILAADHGLLPAAIFRTNAWRLGNISTDRDSDGVLRKEKAYMDYRNWNPIIRNLAIAQNLNLDKTKIEPGKITFFSKEGNESGVETIAFPTDEQGRIMVTNVPAFAPFETERVWSMGIVLAARQLNLDLNHPIIDKQSGRILLRGPNGVQREIPVDDDNSFYIDWTIGLNDEALHHAGIERLLREFNTRNEGQPVANEWQGKLVLVGSTAVGNDLTDLGATALENSTYLASKHWNVANSLITGRFIRRTPEKIVFLLIVLVGGLSAWITWVVARPVTGSILMTAVAVAYVGVAAALFNRWRIWLPIVLPLFCAGLVTHVSALTYRMTVEQSEKKRIRSMFSRLVSPEVVNKVLGTNAISLGSLAGERREITIYFADIRGFTELTDAAQAEGTEFVRRHSMTGELAEHYFDEQAREVMNTVSLYLGSIADCVKQHSGTLDKYIGDCVMAFWGAPLANPHHAVDAVRCAIEAQRALHALNLEREKENLRREKENPGRAVSGLGALPRLPILSMGSGINTGMAIAGFMGSDAHIVNYTVFGREVNLASRLEGVSGHGRIIIGEGTYTALLRDDPALAKTCVELPPQMVKGFRSLVRVFEVPWQNPVSAPAQPNQPQAGKSAVA